MAPNPSTEMFPVLVAIVPGSNKPPANVYQGGRSQDIRSYYGAPQPAVNVRQEWPRETPNIAPNPEANFSNQSWERQLGGVRATGRMATHDNIPVSDEWKQHSWAARATYLRVQRGECINNRSMKCLLDIIGQGIESAVYMMTSFLSLPGNHQVKWRNGDGPSQPMADRHYEPDRRLPGPSCEVVNVDLPSPGATEDIIRSLPGKRVIATCAVVQRDTHWVALVYDIHAHSLFIFDTVRTGRRERFNALALAWRQFLLNIDMPYEFVVYGPTFSNQTNNVACGLLAAVNIHQCVRVSQGQSLESVIDRYNCEWVVIDGQSQPQMPTKDDVRRIQLPMPMWKMGAIDNKEGFRRATMLINVLLCNELGIRDSQEIERRYSSNGNRLSFSFQRPNVWDPFILAIPSSISWDRLPYRMFSDGSYIVAGLRPPPEQQSSIPISSYATQAAAGYSQQISWKQLAKRYTIRCWNPNDAAFDPRDYKASIRGQDNARAISIATTIASNES